MGAPKLEPASPKPARSWWHVIITLPTELCDFFAEALGDDVDAVTVRQDDAKPERREMLLLLRQEPDPAAWALRLKLLADAVSIPTPAMQIESVPDRDWLEHVWASFKPIEAGRFYIHGSHHAPDPTRTSIQIDAGQAFGSGEHATTQGCLLAIDALTDADLQGTAWDVGCGSAILAIALAHRGMSRVLASDIDAPSVIAAAENATINGVSAAVRCVEADGANHPEVAAYTPCRVVVANILANPLIQLAPDLNQALQTGGVLILSGLLQRQQPEVEAAYRALGLTLERVIPIGEWATLVWRK